MAGERVKLTVMERTVLGSAESRRMRRRGFVPGVVYGRSDPVAVSIDERALRLALTTPAGSHAVIDLAIDGSASHPVILKDFQRDKVRGQIIHVDLQEVRLDQPIQTSVGVTLVGEPEGVKLGGLLVQVATEVAIEALPLEVPQHLEVDVSPLAIGESVRLSSIELPEGVTMLDDPEAVLATVTLPSREEEPAAQAEGEEAREEGEAEAEAPAHPEASPEAEQPSEE